MNRVCPIEKTVENERGELQVFTVEIYPFTQTVSTKPLHLKHISPSLNEHVVFI